jgi:hypothetical protein
MIAQMLEVVFIKTATFPTNENAEAKLWIQLY